MPGGGGFDQLHQDLQNINRTLSEMYTALEALVGSLISLAGNNVFTGVNSFIQPVQLPVYTVAALPVPALGNVGSIAFASNALNVGELAGFGTGGTVQVQNKSGVAVWCSVWSGVAAVS